MLKSLLFATALAAAAALQPIRPAVAAELPQRIATRGALIAAIVPNYPPLELRDPATGALAGFDVELGEAIAKTMGVRMQWQETNFEQMLAAVQTGRVDIIISGMSDLKTRQDTASFVDYLRSGSQFFILASRAAEFPNALALCGKAWAPAAELHW